MWCTFRLPLTYKDLYRCIENLYGFPSIKISLNTCVVNPDCSYNTLYNFREKLRKTWRYTEEASLVEIIKEYENKSMSGIDKFIKLFDDYQGGTKKSVFLGQKLYKLRNSYVHHNIPGRKSVQDDFNNDKWDKIIYEFLTLIIGIYELYK